MAGSGGIGHNPRTRRMGIGGGTALGKPSPKPQPGPSMPPYLTFDPAISAQMRAVERGREDKEAATKTAKHFAKRDLAQSLREIRTRSSRSRGGINRDYTRAQQQYGEREGDLHVKVARANQDFDTQLQNIGRQFAQLGHRQRESQNAAGVIGGGTEAAAQVARGRNQSLAEAPLHESRQQVQEDLATALRRLGTDREQLGADRTRALAHLHADRDRSRRLNRQDYGRNMFLADRELQQTIREEEFALQDLRNQAIFDARSRRPGAFTRTGKLKKGRRV